ncbi:ABC transporter substrate-binding protein [Amycolatopsis jejuensis]|uniref:ABC transporter substrate-binding protein n=1 Tax=Amycolatopsis jejuensis TaxID=330084 RepID=UPI0005248F77|nr:ABC transporter substrate-binding protein [Amycolatopsis jejuensis]
MRIGSARRRAGAGVLAMALAATITGCSLQEDTASSSSGTSAANGGRTFVYAAPGVPAHLDQFPWGGQPSKLVYGVIDSTLVRYHGECDVLGQSDDLEPSLASSWKRGDDGKSVVFTLADATSSAGNPLTAEDVKWSVERQLTREPFIKSALGFIGQFDTGKLVEIVDPKTVKINAKGASSFDVMQFASTLLTIHDSKAAKAHATADDPWATKWLAKNTANFGPWQLDRFDPGNEVSFTKNPHYQGKRGNIDKVVVRSVPESATRMQLVRSGDAAWADSLTFAEYAQLREAKDVKVENCVAADRDDLMLQQKNTVFADPRVRQAVAMAVNRDRIVQAIYRGFGKPAVSGVPQYYKFPAPSATYTYDPARAKQLLAEAGHPNGISFTALYSESRPGPQVKDVAVQLQADLKAAGIEMKLQHVAGAAEFFQLVREHRFEAVFYSDSTFVGDAAYGAAAFTLSTSNINTFGYANPQYDKLVDEARGAEGAQRDGYIKQIAELGVTDTPIVYLVDSSNVQAHRSNINGFSNSPMRTVNPAELTVG